MNRIKEMDTRGCMLADISIYFVSFSSLSVPSTLSQEITSLTWDI